MSAVCIQWAHSWSRGLLGTCGAGKGALVEVLGESVWWNMNVCVCLWPWGVWCMCCPSDFCLCQPKRTRECGCVCVWCESWVWGQSLAWHWLYEQLCPCPVWIFLWLCVFLRSTLHFATGWLCYWENGRNIHQTKQRLHGRDPQRASTPTLKWMFCTGTEPAIWDDFSTMF